MIVATAGHVDHGKTSLVEQLTGIQTDTLDEEIKRGLSINLGYAYCTQHSGESIGFIDVPGHRRFINTMIAGISGIDVGMLVVAADDGLMPQTYEHVDVLDILGVDQLIAVISKTDRVDKTRVSAVSQQVKDFFSSRRWRDVRIFKVSNINGCGVEDLLSHLKSLANQNWQRSISGGFRLSIDRRFTIKGSGLVVTGTASAGVIEKNHSVLLLPSKKKLRVRHLRANNRDTNRAKAGQRVAVGLSGKVELTDIERGDWLVDIESVAPSVRLDSSIKLLSTAPFALKHLAPVKIYLGAKRLAGRIAIIEGNDRFLRPGVQSLVQLILDQPASAILGDRFLMQDHAETSILGGGIILDPVGPKYGKSRHNRIKWLKGLSLPTPEASLTYLLNNDLTVDLTHFWAIRNHLEPAKTTNLPTEIITFNQDGKKWAIKRSLWKKAALRTHDIIHQWHRSHPGKVGINRFDLETKLAEDFEVTVVRAVLQSKLRNHELAINDGFVSLHDFQNEKLEEAEIYWHKLKQSLEHFGTELPLLSTLHKTVPLSETALKRAIGAGLKNGELHRLSESRYALSHQLLHYCHCVMNARREGEDLSISNLKARFQVGRNLTIELLEYFDAIHFTRRNGNTRVITGGDGIISKLSK